MCVGGGATLARILKISPVGGGVATHENTHIAEGDIHDDVSCRTKLT